MHWSSRFWLSKVRGWAAGVLVASSAISASNLLAGESYFIADEQPVVEPSASDLQAPAKAPMAYQPSAAPACNTCGNGCVGPDTDPWRLFQNWNDCHEWKITGFTDAGATANRRDVASRYNGPVTFNDRNEGTLNQLWLTAENAVDTSQYSWDVGGRVDIMYGSDYIFNQTTGFETHDDGTPHWNGNPYYGLVMPQIYGEIAYNDLSVKVGRFFTILGYEVIPATGNFFYSHAYTMQYGEPFYHWGGLATYKYSDSLSLIGGVVNGWDSIDRLQDNWGFVGGALWNNGDGTSVALTGISSNEPNPAAAIGGGAFTTRSMYSLVVSQQINDCWTYVFQNDMAVQNRANPNVPPGAPLTAEWYGINQYLFYTINNNWKAGMRLEWFRDDDGVRVSGVRPGNPNVGSFAGNFYEMTYGLNWTPTTNITVRPELRYDWYDSGNFGGPLPYNDGTDADQFLAAFDVIWLY